MNLIKRAWRVFREEGLPSFIRKTARYIRSHFYTDVACWRLMHLFPRTEDLWILGEGVEGRSRRGGNAKYFFLQIANEVDTDIVWLSDDDDEIALLREHGYPAYHVRSLRGQWQLLRAGRIFCTNGMDFTWWKTGGTDIVQLWHGIPPKKAGWDVVKHRSYSPEKVRKLRYATYNWDYLVTTSRNPPADILRRAFRMNEEQTLVVGNPRTDILLSDVDHLGMDVDTEMLDRLDNLPESAFVFMYAPTWRRDYDESTNPLTRSGIDVQELDEYLRRTNSYLVLKLHPWPNAEQSVDECERVLWAEPRSDPYPLLEHIDAMIADYSSLFIDYLILDRPIIFFPYDLKEYDRKEGLYYRYDSLAPGFMPDTPDELYSYIETVAEGTDPHQTERRVMRDLFYDHTDGNAARRIYEFFA